MAGLIQSLGALLILPAIVYLVADMCCSIAGHQSSLTLAISPFDPDEYVHHTLAPYPRMRAHTDQHQTCQFIDTNT